MKRGREVKKGDETSPSRTRLRHDGVINYIPLDVTAEILKKLPTKSLMKLLCVSKLWSSIISSRRDFIDSIVTRSLNQPPPRDLYIISHHPSNQSYHQSVRGLVCCWSESLFRMSKSYVVTIYNPTTRQSFDLPELKSVSWGSVLFGYDPFKNQYKVLFIPTTDSESCQVFTLADPTAKQWRNIQHFITHDFMLEGVVCINGTIYYREKTIKPGERFPLDYKLMSFDVRSETFHHVQAPKLLMYLHRDSVLINYQDKLGLISCERGVEIWVMETQGWSKCFVCEMEVFHQWNVSGITRGGEIVFVKSFYCSNDKLHVYYYDLKRNSMRYVDLEDCYTEEGSRKGYFRKIWTSPDHVDNTMGLY